MAVCLYTQVEGIEKCTNPTMFCFFMVSYPETLLNGKLPIQIKVLTSALVLTVPA